MSKAIRFYSSESQTTRFLKAGGQIQIWINQSAKMMNSWCTCSNQRVGAFP